MCAFNTKHEIDIQELWFNEKLKSQRLNAKDYALKLLFTKVQTAKFKDKWNTKKHSVCSKKFFQIFD